MIKFGKIMGANALTFKWQNINGPDIEFTDFPVELGRTMPLFEPYKEKENDLWKFMSRNQAELTKDNDRFYIRDLGSKNGTILNGRKVTQKTELNSGDELVFPSSFRFMVQLEINNGHEKDYTGEVDLESHPMPDENENKTKYFDFTDINIDMINSFIRDIRGTRKDKPGEKADEAKEKSSEAEKSNIDKEKPMGKGIWNKRITYVLILILFVAAGVTFFFVSRPHRWKKSVTTYVSNNEYEKAIAICEQYIRKYSPEEKVVNDWWISQLNTNGSMWKAQWQSKDWNAIRSSVDSLGEKARILSIIDLRRLDFIVWAADAQEYFETREGKTLFIDEYRIVKFLERWQELFAGKLPGQKMLKGSLALKQIEKEANSRKRLLQSEYAVYVKKVFKLNEELKTNLLESNIEKVRETLKKYNLLQANGTDRLNTDFKLWENIVSLNKDKQFLSAWSQLEKSQVYTSPFEPAFEKLKEDFNNFQNTIEIYENATDLWQNRKYTASIEILRDLSKQIDDAKIEKELKRKEAVASQYLSITNKKEGREFFIQLVRFYKMLDTNEDKWIINEFSSTYQRALSVLKDEAGKHFMTGKRSWNKYQKNPVTVKEILNASQRYRFYKMVKSLKTADKGFARATWIYDLLSEDIKGIASLHRSVRDEIKRQKSNVANARFLLAPDEYQKMLKALDF